MDDLPDLPFEKVMSYLDLEDVIKSRAVSRSWRDKINMFRVKSLCYSTRPIGFIYGKSRLVNGPFAQNFISSNQFEHFFSTFGHSILSNLKHLRLCNLYLDKETPKAFAKILQSFSQLEELDIIRFGFPFSWPHPRSELELSLPMLRSIQLEYLSGIDRLTLDAPRLQKVRLNDSLGRMNLVHVDSVECVITDKLAQLAVKRLKNLKQLYVKLPSSIDPTLLSSLDQLKEISLDYRDDIPEIFEQKQRYRRTDLKVYLFGLLLNDRDGPEMSDNFSNFNRETFRYWAENVSRLTDEIPFYDTLYYDAIEHVAPELAINILKKLTDLTEVIADRPVQNIERFQGVLKSFHKIASLEFHSSQPQELFDRLPEHCAVQRLAIYHPGPEFEFEFLFRLEFLMHLTLLLEIDAELIRRIFEKLEFIYFLAQI